MSTGIAVTLDLFSQAVRALLGTGAGIVVDEIGNSRTVGQGTTRGDGYRYPLSQWLPLMIANGVIVDIYGARHDGVAGYTSADIAAACAASAALTPAPTHAIVWAGVNDESNGIAPATTRTNLLSRYATLIAGANVPKVLVVRDMPVPAHLPQIAPADYGRTRGLAAWNANALVDVQVGLGLGARFAVVDPRWSYPADYYLGYDIHQSDAGAARLGLALAGALSAFPSSGAATPRSVSQGAVQAAVGADLLHAFDGRDTPTEVAGLMSQWAAFVGGLTLDQATAGIRPTWSGGAYVGIGNGGLGKYMVPSGPTAPLAWTFCCALQPYETPSTDASGAEVPFLLDGPGGLSHHGIGFTDTTLYIRVANATRNVVMSFPYAYEGGKALVVTATFDNVDQQAVGSYSARVNGVDLGAPTKTADNAGDYSALFGPAVGASPFGGAYASRWNGTIDALQVANAGLSAAKRNALEAFATAALT